MSAAGALAIVAVLFPAVIGILAKLEKLLGPKVFRWLRSHFNPNARAS